MIKMCKMWFAPSVDDELLQPLSDGINNAAYYPINGIKLGAESIPPEDFFGKDNIAMESLYHTIEDAENDEFYDDIVPRKHKVRLTNIVLHNRKQDLTYFIPIHFLSIKLKKFPGWHLLDTMFLTRYFIKLPSSVITL